MKLSLGVDDVSYSDPDVNGAVTTGEVAEFLEKKYHVMEVFYELHKKEIAEQVTASVVERMEAALQGNPHAMRDVPIDDIKLQFQKFLGAGEWEQVSGQTIAAAQKGVSHRKKSRRYNDARVAFVDTGLYQRSFEARLK